MLKTYLFITFFLLQVTSSLLHAQEVPRFEVSSIEDPSILKKLFDSERLDSGVVIWKPNFAEAIDFVPSYDGMCYTNVDTIMHYTTGSSRGGEDTKYALIVFTTYTYVAPNEAQGCRMCGPAISLAVFTYEPSTKKWEFQEMKKYVTRHGIYGAMSDRSLRKIGDDTYALELENGDMHMGYMNVWTSFYDLSPYRPSPFEQILWVPLHSDNDGAAEKPSESYSWDRTISFVKPKTASEYDDVILTKTGRGRKLDDDYDSPVVKLSLKERYHFDMRLSRYVLSK